jgi:hypothetical protein
LSSHRQGPQAQLPSDVQTAEIDLFQLRQKRESAELNEKNENVDSHLGFKFPVKAPGYVGAALFLFLKYSLIKGLDGFKTAQSTQLPGMREGGALDVLP